MDSGCFGTKLDKRNQLEISFFFSEKRAAHQIIEANQSSFKVRDWNCCQKGPIMQQLTSCPDLTLRHVISLPISLVFLPVHRYQIEARRPPLLVEETRRKSTEKNVANLPN
jgi:hypothetical protein